MNFIKLIKDLVAPLYLIYISIKFKGENRVYNKLKIIFVVVPKTGNSSINKLLLEKSGINLNFKDYNEIHKLNYLKISQKEILYNNKYKDYFKFAFVRSPFSRLVSCYENKIKKENHFIKKAYPFYFNKNMSFESFVKRVCLLPDRFREIHFKSQYSFLYYKNKKIVDYIGKFENLENDFNFIKKKYNLDKLPHLNKTNNFKEDFYYYNYYNLELVELVYKSFYKDFQELNYQNEYFKIKKFLKNKKNR